jgi:hypothetical protein
MARFRCRVKHVRSTKPGVSEPRLGPRPARDQHHDRLAPPFETAAFRVTSPCVRV